MEQFIYSPGLKALASEDVATGDLLIEGWAANFDGMDRTNENFRPGAFLRGIKSFLEGSAPLCFHHQKDKVLGRVLDLEERPGGLWLTARVEFQPESSPLRYLYNSVKRGSVRNLSIGGFFKRSGQKITDVDFTEVSLTAVPAHPATHVLSVEQKALMDDLDGLRADVAIIGARTATARLDRAAAVAALRESVRQLPN